MGQNTVRLSHWEGEGGGLPFQTSHVAAEVVLVSRNGTRIGILPESVVAPSSRQSTNGASMAGDPQRARSAESGVVTCASLPPIGGGVNHRVAADTGMVGVGEAADPANHRSGAQAIASGTIWVICPIDVQLEALGGSRYVHSMSRAPGRVTSSSLQPPPLEAK